MTAQAATAGVDPAVWTVLALLMGAGGALAALLSWREERAAGRRMRSVAGPGQSPPAGRALRGPADAPSGKQRRTRGGTARLVRDAPVREAAAALSAVAFGVVVLGGAVGWLAGGAGAWAVWHRQRRRARCTTAGGADAAVAGAVDRRLPLTAELMAACLTAGSGPAQAAQAVGRSTGGPLGDRLLRAAAELRLGGEPAAVWGRFGELPGCEGLARCMERAGTAGVPPVQAVARLAAECRARRARAATARARRAAVLVTGPLGLCFLPAFLAVGVAPVVLGLARSLL